MEKHIERLDDQLHGWLSARTDLEGEKVRKSLKEDIKTVLEFLGKHF